jgi:hypothetical protein
MRRMWLEVVDETHPAVTISEELVTAPLVRPQFSGLFPQFREEPLTPSRFSYQCS